VAWVCGLCGIAILKIVGKLGCTGCIFLSGDAHDVGVWGCGGVGLWSYGGKKRKEKGDIQKNEQRS
jgi:hypothetical protein